MERVGAIFLFLFFVETKKAIQSKPAVRSLFLLK